MLLYASEVLPFNSGDYKSLDFAINCAFGKIFATYSKDVIWYCRYSFAVTSVEETIANRRKTFLQRLSQIDNLLCAICN